MWQCQIHSACWEQIYTANLHEEQVTVGSDGKQLLHKNKRFSGLTSNFPFFSCGSTWASFAIAASLLGTPSPSISSTIITVSHFPKLVAGNMSDLMLSPKYTTCRMKRKNDDLLIRLQHNSGEGAHDYFLSCTWSWHVFYWSSYWTRPDTKSLQNSSHLSLSCSCISFVFHI